MANLKVFSSDAALVNEFIASLFVFIDKEKKRDEVNRETTVSFDVEDPSPHKEWVKSHDKLFKKVDWKNISSWFCLFSLNDQSKGSEIIKKLEEQKRLLSSIEFKNHDQTLSSHLVDISTLILEKRLSLAQKITTLILSVPVITGLHITMLKKIFVI